MGGVVLEDDVDKIGSHARVLMRSGRLLCADTW